MKGANKFKKYTIIPLIILYRVAPTTWNIKTNDEKILGSWHTISPLFLKCLFLPFNLKLHCFKTLFFDLSGWKKLLPIDSNCVERPKCVTKCSFCIGLQASLPSRPLIWAKQQKAPSFFGYLRRTYKRPK